MFEPIPIAYSNFSLMCPRGSFCCVAGRWRNIEIHYSLFVRLGVVRLICRKYSKYQEKRYNFSTNRNLFTWKVQCDTKRLHMFLQTPIMLWCPQPQVLHPHEGTTLPNPITSILLINESACLAGLRHSPPTGRRRCCVMFCAPVWAAQQI